MSDPQASEILDKARVEALLFAAEEPRTVRWMANFLKLQGRYVRKLLNRLIREYEKRESALEIREVYKDLGVPDDMEARPDQVLDAANEEEFVDPDAPEEHSEALDLEEEDQEDEPALALANSMSRPKSIPAYHMAVREHLQEVVQKLLPPEVSKPVLGTLSVIATRQPILQSEIIHIRGKRAYMHIKDLLVHKLIRRRPVDGTYSLSTTQEFQKRYQIDTRAASRARKAGQSAPAPAPAVPEVAPPATSEIEAGENPKELESAS